jgi:hypothetical protein
MFSVEANGSVWQEAFAINAPIVVDVTAGLSGQFMLNLTINSVTISSMTVVNSHLSQKIDATLLESLL